MLDRSKREGMSLLNFIILLLEVEAAQTIDVSPAYIRDDYQYLRKSHKTLLMFRRL